MRFGARKSALWKSQQQHESKNRHTSTNKPCDPKQNWGITMPMAMPKEDVVRASRLSDDSSIAIERGGTINKRVESTSRLTETTSTPEDDFSNCSHDEDDNCYHDEATQSAELVSLSTDSFRRHSNTNHNCRTIPRAVPEGNQMEQPDLPCYCDENDVGEELANLVTIADAEQKALVHADMDDSDVSREALLPRRCDENDVGGELGHLIAAADAAEQQSLVQFDADADEHALDVREAAPPSSRRRTRKSCLKPYDPRDIPVSQKAGHYRKLVKPNLDNVYDAIVQTHPHTMLVKARSGGGSSQTTSATTAMTSSSASGSCKKKVGFAHICIRNYDQTVGDNPAVSYGPPVSLDWYYEECAPITLDSYELERGPRRKPRQMMLNYYHRVNLLTWRFGVSEAECKAAEKIVNVCKRERNMTRALLPAACVEEALQSLRRKAAKKKHDCTNHRAPGPAVVA